MISPYQHFCCQGKGMFLHLINYRKEVYSASFPHSLYRTMGYCSCCSPKEKKYFLLGFSFAFLPMKNFNPPRCPAQSPSAVSSAGLWRHQVMEGGWMHRFPLDVTVAGKSVHIIQSNLEVQQGSIIEVQEGPTVEVLEGSTVKLLLCHSGGILTQNCSWEQVNPPVCLVPLTAAPKAL